ncbi:hypothetical protein MKX01_023005 [Papaver californicum]|nr:hypothetical protein MKX01_023005 [Papaver californicum]
MAETQPTDEQVQSPQQGEDMISCVMALEAALLPYLPARELQAINRSPHPSYQKVKSKSDLIKKHGKLILGWRKELKDQLDKHIRELEKV